MWFTIQFDWIRTLMRNILDRSIDAFMGLFINNNKIVVFTGAGVSAESGLQTFRDSGGLWEGHSVKDFATLEGWKRDPEKVLLFYNDRKEQVLHAEPNQAHRAIAELEKKFKVVVITQNVDDLHERAGSTNVIHLHGQLSRARSSIDPKLTYELGDKPVLMGELCRKGSQLRPDIVWFGEKIQNYKTARKHIRSARRVLIVGTSLEVFPAAGLVREAQWKAEKIIVAPEMKRKPNGFAWLKGTATSQVPMIVRKWLD